MTTLYRRRSLGRRVTTCHRIVVRVTFANGNTQRHEEAVPDWRWGDEWAMRASERLAVLRASLRADATADATRTTWSRDDVDVTRVAAGIKA